MKRKKNLAKAVSVMVGAAAVSAMLAGCDLFSPEENQPVAIYGPPEMLDPDYNPEDNIPEDVYGPPPFEEDYDEEENLPESVYGPPEWFGEEAGQP